MIVNRQESAGTMVLGPIEFDASGNPRPCQSHQSRFHHLVIVNKMTLLDFVVCHLDASAQFGQNHNLDIFIFQINSVITLFLADIFYLFDHRIRIKNRI